MGRFTLARLGDDSLKKLWGTWLALTTATITIMILTISTQPSKCIPNLKPAMVSIAATFIPVL